MVCVCAGVPVFILVTTHVFPPLLRIPTVLSEKPEVKIRLITQTREGLTHLAMLQQRPEEVSDSVYCSEQDKRNL